MTQDLFTGKRIAIVSGEDIKIEYISNYIITDSRNVLPIDKLGFLTQPILLFQICLFLHRIQDKPNYLVIAQKKFRLYICIRIPIFWFINISANKITVFIHFWNLLYFFLSYNIFELCHALFFVIIGISHCFCF